MSFVFRNFQFHEALNRPVYPVIAVFGDMLCRLKGTFIANPVQASVIFFSLFDPLSCMEQKGRSCQHHEAQLAP